MIQPIFLVGARGSGKTTVGHCLATQLGYSVVDTDNYLLTSTGKTVAEIVAEEGWAGFRKRESEALKKVTAPYTVVATGGGMVLAEENRQFMQENGSVIWLNVPASLLAARLSASPEEGQRPTLTGKSMTEEITEVLAAREELYRQTASVVIDAVHAPEKIAQSIVSALQLSKVNSCC